MSGYVRIHRSLIGHPAFRNDAEAMAFAWLVAKAAWRPIRVRYKEHCMTLDRGQLALSVRDFASAMDRDKAWVERLLKRLKSEAMVETATKSGVTVITICNYGQYQTEKVPHKTVDETPDETEARQAQDTEQEREEREEVIIPPTPQGKKSGKTLLPEDWILPTVAELPPQARACAQQWLPASYAARGEEFISFWRSRGRMMRNWRLTWAGRVVDIHGQVMRDQKFGTAPPTVPKYVAPKSPDEALAWYRQNAIFFRSVGREDDARRCDAHAKAILEANPELEPKPDSKVVALVEQTVERFGRRVA